MIHHIPSATHTKSDQGAKDIQFVFLRNGSIEFTGPALSTKFLGAAMLDLAAAAAVLQPCPPSVPSLSEETATFVVCV